MWKRIVLVGMLVLGCAEAEQFIDDLREAMVMDLDLNPVFVGGTDAAQYGYSTARTMNWVPLKAPPGEPYPYVYGPFPHLATSPSYRLDQEANGGNQIQALVNFGTTATVYAICNKRFWRVTPSIEEFSGGPTAAPANYTVPLSVAVGSTESDQSVFLASDSLAGSIAWVADMTSRTITSLSGTTLGNATNAVFFGQRFIIGLVGTGKFQWSALSDGTTWPAANVATAELEADNVTALAATAEALAVVGKTTTEWWAVTADANAPYQRIAGASVPVGSIAKHTIASTFDAVYFLDSEFDIVEVKPGSYRKITDDAFRTKWSINVSTGYAHILHMRGHLYYALVTGTTDDPVLLYDIGSGQWIEWGELASVSASNTTPSFLSVARFPSAAADYIGSATDGSIRALDYRTPRSNQICRRITPMVSVGGKQLVWDEVDLRFVGGGTGNVNLSYSDDGGTTWSTRESQAVASIDGNQPIRFFNQGIGRQRAWRIEVDAAYIYLAGAYAKVRVLDR